MLVRVHRLEKSNESQRSTGQFPGPLHAQCAGWMNHTIIANASRFLIYHEGEVCEGVRSASAHVAAIPFVTPLLMPECWNTVIYEVCSSQR